MGKTKKKQILHELYQPVWGVVTFEGVLKNYISYSEAEQLVKKLVASRQNTMNKDQRKYLTDWVISGFNKEKDAIKARRYARPSLNNYLVADALNEELVMKSVESITKYLRKRLIDQGKEKALTSFIEPRNRTYYNANDEPHQGKHVLTMPVEEMFELPGEYQLRMLEWEANEKQIEKDLEHLEGMKETVLLKVNIGSWTL